MDGGWKLNFKCRLGLHKHPSNRSNPLHLNEGEKVEFYCLRCGIYLHQIVIGNTKKYSSDESTEILLKDKSSRAIIVFKLLELEANN